MSVVVGYIPTHEGQAALAHAKREALERRRTLVVVNTSRGDALVDPRYAQDDELAELRTDLDSAGVKFVFWHRMSGREAAEEILEAAEMNDADVIVIGIRKRSPVGKLLLGSTAQRILFDAPCPVLAVKEAP
jgi:nucleotide-binding universal stress UspA family protein